MTTLNDMTPEALRDLASRASATAYIKEQEAADAKRKAEKDIIPPAGTFWRYNDRVWTVAEYTKETSVLLSADSFGQDLRYRMFYAEHHKTFTSIKPSMWAVETWAAGGHPIGDIQQSAPHRESTSFQAAVGRLILTARDIK